MSELSLLGMAARLVEAEIAVRVAAHTSLERVAEAVERTAKSEFGIYQSAVGSFKAWSKLADATKAERVRLGFTENDPLLRTGDLRDSVGHEVEGMDAAIGSTSDVMVYQELGTSRIPPRPVLGPALQRNKDLILAELAGAVTSAILGDTAYDYSKPLAAVKDAYSLG